MPHLIGRFLVAPLLPSVLTMQSWRRRQLANHMHEHKLAQGKWETWDKCFKFWAAFSWSPLPNESSIADLKWCAAKAGGKGNIRQIEHKRIGRQECTCLLSSLPIGTRGWVAIREKETGNAYRRELQWRPRQKAKNKCSRKLLWLDDE